MLALSIRGIGSERKHIGKENETLVVGLLLEHLMPENNSIMNSFVNYSILTKRKDIDYLCGLQIIPGFQE